MDGLLRLEGAGILPRAYMIRSTGLTFPALVPVSITRRRRSAALVERLPIDVDEDDGLLPSWTIDPDGGGHRRRPRIDALPHAAGRPTIRAAARQRALAFLEAVLRESGQDLFRRRHPPALRLDPRHPAVTPELRQTAHFSHGPSLEVRRSRGYWTKVPCRLTPDGRLHDGVARVELRDPTRGGVATALNELAYRSAVGIVLDEAAIPVSEPVRGVCELLDPLYVANEGKLLAIVSEADAARVGGDAAPSGRAPGARRARGRPGR